MEFSCANLNQGTIWSWGSQGICVELFGPNTWHNHLVPGIFVNHIGLWSLPMLEAEHQTFALQNIRTAFKAGRSILRIHCRWMSPWRPHPWGIPHFTPSWFSFYILLFLWDRASLWIPGCSWTHHVHHSALELKEIHLLLSPEIKDVYHHAWPLFTFSPRDDGETEAD